LILLLRCAEFCEFCNITFCIPKIPFLCFASLSAFSRPANMYSYSLSTSALLLLATLSHAEVTTVFVTKYAVATGTDGSFRVAVNATTRSPLSAQTTLSLFDACSAGTDNSTNSCTGGDITYYGAVITADPTATVFAIDCAARFNSTTCGTETITVTQGPSMFARVQTFPGITTASDGGDDGSSNSSSTAAASSDMVSVSCDITSSTQAAVCQQVDVLATSLGADATGTGAANFVTNSINGTAAGPTVTMSFGAAEIHYNSLIITSGAEKLASATPTRTPKAPSCKFFFDLKV
jgi:hypothetical protein